MVGRLRIAPAARADVAAPTLPLLLAVAPLTKADGLTNASVTPINNATIATMTLMTNIF